MIVDKKFGKPTTYAVDGIPFIGKQLGRVGRLNDLLMTPCDATPMIIVQGFFTALPLLAQSILIPDCEDVIQWKLEGGAGLGQAPAATRHGKRRRRIKMKGPEFSKPYVAPPTGGIGLAAFKIASKWQQIGFWFSVIDGLTNGAYTWASLVYQWAGCGGGALQNAEAIGDCIVTPGFDATVLWSEQWDPAHYISPNEWVIPGGVNADFFVAGQSSPYIDPPFTFNGHCQFQVEETTTGHIYPLPPSLNRGDDPTVYTTGERLKLGVGVSDRHFRLRAVDATDYCITQGSILTILGDNPNPFNANAMNCHGLG